MRTPENKWREMRELKAQIEKLISELYEFDDAGINAILVNRLVVASEIFEAKMLQLKQENDF